MTSSTCSKVDQTLYGLFALARELERGMASSLGVNLTDYRALCALAESEPMTAGKLADFLGSTAATTSAIINRLESCGYVTRHRSPEDRRLVHLSVTMLATAQIQNLMDPIASGVSENFQLLLPDQQICVSNFLDVTQQLMRDHLKDIPMEGTA